METQHILYIILSQFLCNLSVELKTAPKEDTIINSSLFEVFQLAVVSIYTNKQIKMYNAACKQYFNAYKAKYIQNKHSLVKHLYLIISGSLVTQQ